MFFLGYLAAIGFGYLVFRTVLYFVDKDMYSHFEIRNRMLEGPPLHMKRLDNSAAEELVNFLKLHKMCSVAKLYYIHKLSTVNGEAYQLLVEESGLFKYRACSIYILPAQMSAVLKSVQAYPEIQPIYTADGRVVMKCYNWKWKELVDDDRVIVEAIAKSIKS